MMRTQVFPAPRLAAACIVLAAQAALAQIPAFSGADGAAANVTGGRGGIVYHVTKLDKNYSDAGPGTLRYGLTDSNFANQPRTIVFDVAGTFWLGRYGAENGHDNGWDTQSRLNIGSNVTIAGQTAPGPVNIMGGVVKPSGNNAIIRNVTIAPGYGMRSFSKPEDGIYPTPGDFPDSYVYDAIDMTGQNIMIDHVTTLYATDESISMNELAGNITVQYSNISQGQNYPQADAEASTTTYTGHALGSLLEAGNTTSKAAVTFHHNLYAHQKSRIPQTQGGGLGGYYDFRNNVFYNWLGTAGSRSGTTYWNLVNNFYLAGDGGDNPVGGSSTAITTASGGTGVIGTNSNIYRNGNRLDSNKDADANDSTALSNSGAAAPIWMSGQTYNGVTDSATTAYSRVLDYMGSNWWNRSAPDARIANEVRTGTGKIMAWADDPFNSDPNEGTEWRAMLALRADPVTGNAPFVRAANWDTDADGMPDHWEVAHGLSPLSANNNGDFDSDGYTDIEEYINDLAAWPAPSAITFSNTVSTRYAQIQNWHLISSSNTKDIWQPSRYDTARITSGTVVVDAAGQHAGTLQITGGTLQSNSGWLEVATELQNNSTLNIAGGVVYVNRVTGTGTTNLTGGTLVIAEQVAPFTVNNQGTLSITGTGVLDLKNNRLEGLSNSEASLQALAASGKIITTSGGGARRVGYMDLGATRVVSYAAAGDTDLDGEVGTTDILNILAEGKLDTVDPATWFQGDFDHSGFADTSDILEILGDGELDNGPYNLVGNNPGKAKLIYNPSTGNITIDTNGLQMTGFNLNAVGGEQVFDNGPTSFPSGALSTTDNNTRIAYASVSGGFNGIHDLGNVADTGLTYSDLLSIFDGSGNGTLDTHYTASGQAGRQNWDLSVVPEPTTLGLLGLAAMGMGRRRRVA